MRNVNIPTTRFQCHLKVTNRTQRMNSLADQIFYANFMTFFCLSYAMTFRTRACCCAVRTSILLVLTLMLLDEYLSRRCNFEISNL